MWSGDCQPAWKKIFETVGRASREELLGRLKEHNTDQHSVFLDIDLVTIFLRFFSKLALHLVFSNVLRIENVGLANLPRLRFTAGVHPHDAKSCDDKTIGVLRKLAASPLCVAIGECGAWAKSAFELANHPSV